MPENILLKRLVQIYETENIRYPNLKAITLAQWLVESARGTSALATQHYNFAGLKWRPEMKPFATRVLYKAHDGEDFYCKFATLESFINGYWAFLNRSPYSGWEEHTQTAQDFIGFIGPRYTPNPGYVSQVLSLEAEARALLEAIQTTPFPSSPAQPFATVVIDPGHGGVSRVGGSSPNNAISASGVKEKKLTLDFAFLLSDALTREAAAHHKGLKVVLTRDGDFNVGLAERAQTAAHSHADLFLSLHFNGGSPGTRGTEAFYQAKENGNLNPDEDLEFADLVCSAVVKGLKKFDPAARTRGAKPDTQSGPGALGVLNDRDLGNTGRPQKCRACLLEIEFIDQPAVSRLLVSGPNAIKVRKEVMQTLAKAMVDYLEQLKASA